MSKTTLIMNIHNQEIQMQYYFLEKGRVLEGAFGVIYLYTIYNDYKKNFFPKLLQDPNSTRGQAEDKGVVEKALESIRKTTL
jgi:hypothetical protein